MIPRAAAGESMTVQTQQRSGGGEHSVRFYERDEVIEVTVGDYLIEGMRFGAGGVLIATKAHLEAIEVKLACAGIDLAQARADERYVALDAAAMLAQFRRDGRMDTAAFRAEIGVAIEGVARAGRPVLAYGEMVTLLWDAGDVLGTIELEKLWNDLQTELDFSLLCAYRGESVARHEHAHVLDEVCGLHTQVLGEAEARFDPKLDGPAAARHFIRALLRARGDGDRPLAHDAQLVVSELATNAVIHARTPFSVSMRHEPAAIRISVADASPLHPIVEHTPPTALSGRGLRLVDAVAGSWGVEHGPAGKTVWAEVPRR
jgi:anti-sigma regulatory factor (Ser/Thr protein kinase)